MTFHQKTFALIVAVSFLVFVLELVRRRKVKEEYSWLWIFAGAMMFLLVVWPGLLMFVTHAIGAGAPTTTVFLFGFMFLLLINLDYSARISDHKEQIKKLTQRVGILKKELTDFKNQK